MKTSTLATFVLLSFAPTNTFGGQGHDIVSPVASITATEPEAVVELDSTEPARDVASVHQASKATLSGSQQPSYLRQVSEKPAPSAPATGGAQVGRVALALGLLALLGIVALYAKRRRGISPYIKTQVRLHILSSLQLGPKSKVALVSVGREALLLGISDKGVSCLRTYPEDELWSLTAELPGFSEEIARHEQQTRLAQRPHTSESLLEKGMDTAFSDILKKAGRGTNATTGSDRDKASDSKPKTEAFDRPVMPITRLADHAARTQRTTQPKTPSPTHLAATEDFPPHLAALLAEVSETGNKPHSQVINPKPSAEDSFGESEGQAAELMRRFSEISS